MNDTKDIAEWAREQLEKMSRDPALAEAISKEELNAEIAQQIHNFRTQANLSQKQLAEKSGTKQSVVSRIEDDNYDGHSLKLLHKIAWALNLKLIVKFVEKQATIYYCNPIILDTANYTLPVPPVITGTTFSLGTLPINRIGGYQLVSGSNSQRVVRERS